MLATGTGTGTGTQPATPEPRPEFAVDAAHGDGHPRLRVRGPVDITTAEEFAAQGQHLVLLAAPGGPAHAVLDLVHLPHIASTRGHHLAASTVGADDADRAPTRLGAC